MEKIDTEKFNARILISVVIVLTLLFVTVVSIIMYSQKSDFEYRYKSFHDTIHGSIKHTFEYHKKQYRFLLKRISNITNMNHYILENNKDALYKALKPRLDLLQEKNKGYLRGLYIITHEGKLFLKVDKSERINGESALMGFIEKEVIRSQKTFSGYECEEGRVVFKVMVPLFEKERFIGAIGIGVDTAYFLEMIKIVTNESGILFLNKNRADRYIRDDIFSIGDYRLLANINEIDTDILKYLPKEYNFEDDLHLSLDGGKEYILHVIDIKEFDDTVYAKYLFINDITDIVNIQRTTRVYIISAIVLFVIISFFIIRFYLRKLGSDLDGIYNKIIDTVIFDKAYLKAVEDNSSNLIITSLNRKLFSANLKYLDFMGFKSVQELKERNICIADLFIKRAEFLQKEVEGIYWTQYIFEHPNKIHKAILEKEGKEYIFQVTASLLNIDDQKRYVITFSDITEIEKIKQRYEIAIMGMQGGLWDWNLKNGEVYFSPKCKEMLGYDDSEISNDIKEWKERVHPEDEDRVYRDIKANHDRKIPTYENIYRLKHKEGRWVWILNRGKTIFDEKGKAVRMVGFYTDITRQKELESKLERNQRVYLDFFESTKSANIIYTTPDNGETFFIKNLNHMVEEYEGLRKDEIIGRRIDEVFENVEEFGLLEIIKDVYKSDRPQHMPTTLYKDNRLTAWRENYVFKLSNGDIVASYEDKTNEKRLEKELDKLKTVIEQSPLSIVITDKKGKLEYINPYFTQVTGYSKEEAIGQNPRILKTDHTTKEEYKKIWERITSSKIWSGTFKNRKKNGEEYWELATIVPVNDEKGNIVNYLGIKQEITQQVRLKQEIKEQEEIMIAQSRHAAMGEMISMIAHQWRQPLSVIAMCANNMLVDIELETVDNDTLQENMNEIIGQTEELSKIIDDFKNFFRPEKEAEDVLIVEIFDEAFKVIGKSLQNNDVEVVTDFDNGRTIWTYSRELMQVFINIIKNAKEALVENREDNRKITISTKEDTQEITINICDNGGGIPTRIISKIFDPYFSTKDEKSGTGLGLYMSKTIIEKHLKGKLEVYNKNGGACFKIELPFSLDKKSV